MPLLNDGFPFTTIQACDLGLTPGRLRSALFEGAVRREFRDVYVDSRVPDSRNGRLRAIALVNPGGAVACNETAAWLYGLDVFAPSERHRFEPSFVVEHSRAKVKRSGARGRQAILDSEDVDHVGGVHVTTPLRTASDLLRRMYRPYALAAADAFAHAALIDVGDLVDYVGRLKGYRGIVQARSLAAIVEPRTESAGESWQRLRIHDAGFPPPEPQFEVVDDFGRRFYVDLPYPEMLIGTEFDGREFHTDEVHVAHDQKRRGYLSDRYGWRWVIGTRARLFGDDTSFEDELGHLLGMKPLARWWGTRTYRSPQPTAAVSPYQRKGLVSGR